MVLLWAAAAGIVLALADVLTETAPGSRQLTRPTGNWSAATD
jgi:hypothetical protein